MTFLKHFTKGVDFRDPRLTKSPRVWWQYFWWCISVKIPPQPYLPHFFRLWYIKRTKKNIISWPVLRGVWPYLRRFVNRRKGEFSHRCEFTDKKDGALYGGTSGGFMNRLFEEFIERISADVDTGEYDD